MAVPSQLGSDGACPRMPFATLIRPGALSDGRLHVPSLAWRNTGPSVGPVEGGEHVSLYIAHCSNRCYVSFMSTQPEITQRDLRMRSKEIMDAVEHGQAFTVTRDGRSIGELVPLRQRRRFVSRAEFVAMSRTAPAIDTDAFRADQDAAADQARGAYDQ